MELNTEIIVSNYKCKSDNGGVIKECDACQGKFYTFDYSGPTILKEVCKNCGLGLNFDEHLGLTNDCHRFGGTFFPSSFFDQMGNIPTLPEPIENWFQTTRESKSSRVKSLFLYGPSGEGKTNSALHLLLRFFQAGLKTRYINLVEYLGDKRGSHSSLEGAKYISNFYSEKTEKIRDSLRHADVVVFDNIGNGVSTSWTTSQYETLITERHASGKITIYVSNFCGSLNLSMDGILLESLIGNRAYRRINESEKFYLEARVGAFEKKPESFDFKLQLPRPLGNDEASFLNIWCREGLFRMVSTNERAKLTAKSKINSRQINELPSPQPREYISWSNLHVKMEGPVVDYGDANVLAAVIKIFHRQGREDVVTTTMPEIAKELSLSSDSGTVTRGIKRSLTRLSNSRVTLRKYYSNNEVRSSNFNDDFWIGGFIDSFHYCGQNRGRKIIIKLNSFMVPFYTKKAVTFLPLTVLSDLTLYAQGIFRFLLGHADRYKFISLEKWREVLAISEEVKQRSFKQAFKCAFQELLRKKIILPESNIDKRGIVHTYLPEKTEFSNFA